MAGEFEFEITQAMIDKAIRQVYEKYAPRIENILRSHIESDIEGTTIGTATGGPWYISKAGRWSGTRPRVTYSSPRGRGAAEGWSGRPYAKRHVLSGAVTHKIEGNKLLVSSTAFSDPSVITGAAFGGWGNYLEFFEVGNQGFKGSFRRPAVTNAQKDADKLIPEMEAEAIRLVEAMVK